MSLPDDIEQRIERMVLNFRTCGTPTTRKNWLVVVTCLLPCSDEILEEIGRQARMLGLHWLVPVTEGLLTEIAAGRAYRDESGALRLREKPKAEGLQVLN